MLPQVLHAYGHRYVLAAVAVAAPAIKTAGIEDQLGAPVYVTRNGLAVYMPTVQLVAALQRPGTYRVVVDMLTQRLLRAADDEGYQPQDHADAAVVLNVAIERLLQTPYGEQRTAHLAALRLLREGHIQRVRESANLKSAAGKLAWTTVRSITQL